MTAFLDMPTARAAAESLMSSTCTIRTRATGEPTTDPESGEVTAAVGAVVYSGPCRVRPEATRQTGQGGGEETFTFDYKVSIPFAAVGVLEGHLLTVDSSPDPALVGVEVEVQKVDRGEHITARRLFCSEVA